MDGERESARGWVDGRVIERIDWAEGLFTLRIALLDVGGPGAPLAEVPFEPGQFLNVACEVGGERLRRAYSPASRPGDPLELFVVRVEGGGLSPHLSALHPGAHVAVERRAHGFFTLEHVPEARDLWCLATGTGLSPYLSMLRSDTIWRRFERVVIVHGVRRHAHFAYRDTIEALAAEHRDGARVHWVGLVSREQPGTDPALLDGRIPTAIEDGRLERAAGLSLSPERSHVMLCGNPAMIAEAQLVLGARGLRKHRRREPGHVTFEKYW